MAWINITRNLVGYEESVIGYLIAQNILWAIIQQSTTSAGLRRHLDASAGAVWYTEFVPLPSATSYRIYGAIEDTENNRLYISNGDTGEIYYNITGNPADPWATLLNRTYGGFTGEDAKIRQLIYYNRNVYVAHRGGVSVLDYNGDSSEWTVIGDFNTGLEGIGECFGFTILNNELYVTVAFESLGAVYKYNKDVVSTQWEKFAEFPVRSLKPQYLTTHNNLLFATCEGLDQNVFNSFGIDTTLTGSPRFTHGSHLAGAPSSILEYSEDNNVYATCKSTDFSGQESDTYTNNLILKVQQATPWEPDPGETWFTGFEGVTSVGYSEVTSTRGGYYAGERSSSIMFSIVSNELTLLPDQTYTIVFEYGYESWARKNEISRNSRSGLTKNGQSSLWVGFYTTNKENYLRRRIPLDKNVPYESFIFTKGNLYVNNRFERFYRESFTFTTNDLQDLESVKIRFQGSVGIKLVGNEKDLYESFAAHATIRNIKLYRGSSTVADATYVPAEYTVKEYVNVVDNEKENHIINEPSPPDHWFVKFVSGRIEGEQVRSDPPSDLGGQDEGKGTASMTSDTVKRLSRLIVTNPIDLVANEDYRFNVSVMRGNDSNVLKTLTAKVRCSVPEIPVYTVGITSIGVQKRLMWNFNTNNISQDVLRNTRFWVEAYEEEIEQLDGGAVYISDINLLGKVQEQARNSVYVYDGEAWDDTISSLSDDGEITSEAPYWLIQNYETRSDKVRLYCISGDSVYVWSTGQGDPYGGNIVPRIITSW